MDFSQLDKKNKIYKEMKPLSERVLESIRQDLILKWTHESTALEGNTLTLSETRIFLSEGITIGGKSLKEHMELVNHKEAIFFMEELIKEKKELTEETIKKIQKIVINGDEKNTPGEYRTEPILVTGTNYNFTNPSEVGNEMSKFITWYKEFQGHPVEKATLVHEKLVTIHPFFDGNGRTARILLNFELMKNNYPPIIIEKKEKTHYYRAIKKDQERGDKTDILAFVKTKVESSINNLINLIEKENYKLPNSYKMSEIKNEEFKKAIWFRKNGHYEHAEEIYKELSQERISVEVNMERAKNLSCMGKYENAIKLYELINEACEKELGREEPNAKYHIEQLKNRDSFSKEEFSSYLKGVSENSEYKIIKDFSFYDNYEKNKKKTKITEKNLTPQEKLNEINEKLKEKESIKKSDIRTKIYNDFKNALLPQEEIDKKVSLSFKDLKEEIKSLESEKKLIKRQNPGLKDSYKKIDRDKGMER